MGGGSYAEIQDHGMKRLAIVLLLLGAGWALFAMGKAKPRIELTVADCFLLDDLPQLRRMRLEAALKSTRALLADRNEIYGFRNRFMATWYGVQANAVELSNYLLGSDFGPPEFTRAHVAHAIAGMREYELMFEAARIMKIPICVTQYMVPHSLSDDVPTATAKLKNLEAVLQLLQSEDR